MLESGIAYALNPHIVGYHYKYLVCNVGRVCRLYSTINSESLFTRNGGCFAVRK